MLQKINLKLIAANVGDKRMIVFDPNEWMQRNWVKGKFYEQTLLDYIHDRYKGGTFVDVGGCMGNHAIYFSDLADNVITFEPLRENFYHMTLNINLNEITNIDNYNFGLSDKAELKVMWYDDATFSNGSSTMEAPKKNTTKGRFVPVVTMDSMEINDVTLIKIDVEGHELSVLKGAIETIKRFKPDMFIECATEEEYDVVFEFLKPLGYLKPKLAFNGTPTYLFSTEEKDVPK